MAIDFNNYNVKISEGIKTRLRFWSRTLIIMQLVAMAIVLSLDYFYTDFPLHIVAINGFYLLFIMSALYINSKLLKGLFDHNNVFTKFCGRKAIKEYMSKHTIDIDLYDVTQTGYDSPSTCLSLIKDLVLLH